MSDLHHDLNEDSKQEQLRHAEVLRKHEATQRARKINVPTAIDEVKQKLRELGHPVTLFAEGHADRRDRLREVIAHLELSEEEFQKLQALMSQSSHVATDRTASSSGGPVVQEQMTKQKEVFYSAALEELIAFRKDLAQSTFEKAHDRLARIRAIRDSESAQVEENRGVLSLYINAKEMNLNSSQFADERPLTSVRYSASGTVLASASLNHAVKLWDASNLSNLGVLRGHSDRVTQVAWHPESCKEENNGPHLLATSSADGSCNIWDVRTLTSGDNSTSDPSENAMDVETCTSNDTENGPNTKQTLVHKLKGHHGVVASCAFHPSGQTVATSGYDFSWRLWDLETSKELLLQDGHVKECSAIGFHPDGSLVMTGDAGGVALLWDLRSGQCIAPFQGHIKKISGVSFNANGFQVATSSLDNTVKIWDLRKKKCGYTLPAHSNIVSDLTFSASGELLLTSSFDGTMKLWSSRDLRILRTLSGHSGKVMSADFHPVNEKYVVSAGYDRTVKLWAHKDEF